MRTTVDIDDYVLAAAKDMSSVLEITLGAALSELARRGLCRENVATDHSDGIPVFEVAADSAPITSEMVNSALGEP